MPVEEPISPPHTHLAKLQDHVPRVLVRDHLEVLHRRLGHAAMEVEAVGIQLQGMGVGRAATSLWYVFMGGATHLKGHTQGVRRGGTNGYGPP